MSRLRIAVGPTDHSQGAESAPVTLVEHGDYQCPYCGQAYPILKQVQAALGEKLRFVFRNFPITESHPHAMRAAQFAETAAHAGLFWEARDLLYERRQALDDASLLAYGVELGLSRKSLAAGFDGLYDEKIRSDFAGGLRSGVNGTPCLFVNSLRYDDDLNAATLSEALFRAAL